jgi:hypothetical protein
LIEIAYDHRFSRHLAAVKMSIVGCRNGEISGSHGDKYQDGLVACCTV